MSRIRADVVVNKNATGAFEASEGIKIPASKNITIGNNAGTTGDFLKRVGTGVGWGSIPPASPAQLGLVSIGSGLDVDQNGLVSTEFNGTLADLQDVNLTDPPVIGQFLKWNGTAWIPSTGSNTADKLKNTAAPSTAASTGTAGEIRYDSNFLYICVATNTWKRVAVATW